MRIKMLIMAVLVLALTGCGPDGTTPPPPAKPAAPDLSGVTVTFWAWTYAPNGDEIVATVGFVLTSLTADGNIVTITKQDGTTQLAKYVVPAVLSPYGAEVTLGPGVASVAFALTAVLPKGSTLACEVRSGTKDNPHAPVLSSHSVKLDAQTNALPVANAAVACSFPA